jgi:hypothetical protein
LKKEVTKTWQSLSLKRGFSRQRSKRRRKRRRRSRRKLAGKQQIAQ